jgi:hypothetical protein
MAIKEKLVEGKYIYYMHEAPYSEESFSVSKDDKQQGNYYFEAETHTRVKTGEFLRVNISYTLTGSFEPLNIRIERLLGDKTSVEEFDVDQKTSEVSYVFTCGDITQRFSKIVNGKFHFATPSFSILMLMTHMKKIDPVHRTPYTIVTSKNIWTYEGPFSEEEVYVELQSLDQTQINIGGKDLKATHCKLLQVDENGTIAIEGHDIYLSKYFSIPYKGIFGEDLIIQIDKLKNYEAQRI